MEDWTPVRELQVQPDKILVEGGVIPPPRMGIISHPRRGKYPSCYRNRDKLQRDEPQGTIADLAL